MLYTHVRTPKEVLPGFDSALETLSIYVFDLVSPNNEEQEYGHVFKSVIEANIIMQRQEHWRRKLYEP